MWQRGPQRRRLARLHAGVPGWGAWIQNWMGPQGGNGPCEFQSKLKGLRTSWDFLKEGFTWKLQRLTAASRVRLMLSTSIPDTFLPKNTTFRIYDYMILYATVTKRRFWEKNVEFYDKKGENFEQKSLRILNILKKGHNFVRKSCDFT